MPVAQVRSSAVATWKERLAAALWGRRMFRKGTLSLVDQAVVSAVSFLTMVLLRWAAEDELGEAAAYRELGLYSLAFSIVMLAVCVQSALVTTPYMVYANRLEGLQRARYAGSTLVHQGMFSVLTTLSLALVGGAIAFGWGAETFGLLVVVLAVVAPFILLREFVRRVAYAHLKVVTVLILDLAAAALQLGALVGLKFSGHLTARSAFLATGLACGVAGGAAFYVMRGQFALRHGSTRADLRLNWSFGKWAFAAQLAQLGIAYAPTWMLAILAGTEATGSYAACLSLVMIVNPLLVGFGNVFGPRAASVFHTDGMAALRKLILRVALLMAGSVGVLCIGLMVGGAVLLEVFYRTVLPGQTYVLSILGVCMTVLALAMSADMGLVALRRPAAIFWTSMTGLVTLVGAGWFLIPTHGIVGAAVATLMGTVVATGFRYALFVRGWRQSASGSA